MKKASLILPFCLFALVLGLLTAGHLLTKSTGRLTYAAVLQYRLSYPVCTEIPENALSATFVTAEEPSLEKLAATADTFVYGKISSEPQTLSIRDEKGINADYTLYSLTVINDTQNLLTQDDTITLAMDSSLAAYFPAIRENMRLVVPLTSTPALEDPALWLCSTRQGMFYVTGNGDVLSVYDETAHPSDNDDFNALSGIQLTALMDILK